VSEPEVRCPVCRRVVAVMYDGQRLESHPDRHEPGAWPGLFCAGSFTPARPEAVTAPPRATAPGAGGAVVITVGFGGLVAGRWLVENLDPTTGAATAGAALTAAAVAALWAARRPRRRPADPTGTALPAASGEASPGWSGAPPSAPVIRVVPATADELIATWATTSGPKERTS